MRYFVCAAPCLSLFEARPALCAMSCGHEGRRPCPCCLFRVRSKLSLFLPVKRDSLSPAGPRKAFRCLSAEERVGRGMLRPPVFAGMGGGRLIRMFSRKEKRRRWSSLRVFSGAVCCRRGASAFRERWAAAKVSCRREVQAGFWNPCEGRAFFGTSSSRQD